MARSTRDSKLETRTARLKLEHGKRFTRNIGQHLMLVYRRGPTGGAWSVKLLQADGRYALQSLADADDHQDANGVDVLDYFQAQDKAREVAKAAKENAGIVRKPLTVGQVMTAYMEWFALHKKSAKETAYTVERHILPTLAQLDAATLSAEVLQEWLEELVKAPVIKRKKRIVVDLKDRNALRRRQASANRVLTVLKAALNRAVETGKLKGSAEDWKTIKPFRDVDVPKVRYLNTEECTRLLNACDTDFRPLVRGALLTGCRYGELVKMCAADFNRDASAIHVSESKSGKPRYVPLSDEGRQHFEAMTAGKLGTDLIFTRGDGGKWGDSHQSRRMCDACAVAKIVPAISFHDLRNTYGALLAMRRVSMKVIAELLGHADTRITERHYAHLAPSYVADTLRANLPEFGGGITDSAVTPLRISKAKA